MPGTQRSLRVVYVTYDGLKDPLGQSQVLPYIRSLADRGHRFEVISFEKPGRAPVAWRTPLGANIRWTALRYHKTPTVPATAFDMTQGALSSMLLALLGRADLVHVRSYVAATLSLPLSRLGRRPLLFDMRGLWPEERIEDGTWSKDGRTFRAAKDVEKVLVTNASAITVLTNAMQRHLRQSPDFEGRIRAPIHVIPTCTDLERFTIKGPKSADVVNQTEGCRVLGYLGSFGGRYLSQEMARFYLHWRKRWSPSRLLVLSGHSPEPMRAVLAQAGVADELIHRQASRDEVPSFLRCMDAGMFFHPPTVTNCGAAPTKVGEMLACGVAVVGTAVGDAREMLADGDAGLVLSDMSDDAMARGLTQLAPMIGQPATKTAARALAERWFSLERATDAYAATYRWLSNRDRPAEDVSWPK